MKLKLFITLALFTVFHYGKAQDSLHTSFPMVISFQSHCCGVPSETSVVNFINAFKKRYKIKKIWANHIGPMGKEGEYYLSFELKELNKKQVKAFISKIKKIKILPGDKGSISFNEKMEIDLHNLPRRATSKTMDY